MILLDTDALIELLQKNNERGVKVLEIIKEHKDPATTAISLHELLYGFRKRGIATPDELLDITVLPYTNRDSLLSSELELIAEKRGQKTHRIDAMNAYCYK